MRDTIIANLDRRLTAYGELLDGLDESALRQSVNVSRHKSLGEHLWCVVGARESYARALGEGRWTGFANSMSALGLEDFRAALASSAQAVREALAAVGDWTAERDGLLAALNEHEVMHEGQIIRHMYALERTLPASWKWA